MKRFNTTVVCIPEKHYMVDISERAKEIKKLVDDGKFFTINRARQFGKTTTLLALKKLLCKEYYVLDLDFQGIGESGFSTEEKFVQEFSRLVWNRRKIDQGLSDTLLEKINVWKDEKEPVARLGELFDTLSEWCEESDRKTVIMIDEVDSATNNQVFLDFLAQMRDKYISREKDGIVTFQSVILAGVTDVKHLKGKIRPEDEHKVNSPWNIAADFDIDMSLSEAGIKGMLDEYEADHHVGMDTGVIAKKIWEYTNGYPFLVSRICQLIDEEVRKHMDLPASWSERGFEEAIKLLLAENNSLFESLTKNLDCHPELKEAIRSILMEGTRLTWNGQQDSIVQMQMYGLIRNEHNTVRVANRIFETMLYDLFLSDEELRNNVFSRKGDLERNIFVENGKLNVRKILAHFIDTYHEIYGPQRTRRITSGCATSVKIVYRNGQISGR